MKGPFLASLRFRLLTLVLISIVPVAVLMVYQGLGARQDAAAHVTADMLQLARTASAEQKRHFEQTRGLLRVLTQLPELRAGDLDRCTDLFADLLEEYPGYTGFSLVKPDGSVACSVPAPSGPTSFADRAWFRRLFQTSDFVLGEYLVGRLSGKPVVIAANPILDAAGQIQAIVSVGLDLGWLDRLLAHVPLPPGVVLTVLDRSGTVLARYPDGQQWVGQSMPDVPIVKEVLAHQREGTTQAAGLDGVVRLYAFVPLGDGTGGDSYVYVYAGAPVKLALAQANRTLATNLALLALVGVVGVFGAWLSSGPLVVRPVRALIKATRRLAVGDLTARVEGAPGISELNQLALAFDQMAETLEKHSGQLAESEARFRTLVEQTPAITYVATLDDLSSTLYISPRIQDLLGYSPAEWQAAPELWSRQIHPDDYERVLAELNRSRASGEPFRCEYRMFARDGHLLWLEDTADIVRDESGQSLFLQGLMLDITARKRADEALRAYALQLERSNRELQDFAYVASHDLQEPLRKVQAFGERLVTKYRDALGAEGRDYLDRMHSAAGRMQTMINDLLAYSRVATKAHPSVKVSLTQVARGVLSDLETRIAESHGTVELGDLPTLEADPSQMRQLLQNLIANALKFRRPDVPSLVRVYGQPLAGAPGGEFVQIMVEDNGIGFDTKYLDRIFQPFQRLHGREEYEGTGIGLAICRKIAERHGGHITATSAPGQGATFIVTLPAKQPQGGNPE